jgi:hypothetical protein
MLNMSMHLFVDYMYLVNIINMMFDWMHFDMNQVDMIDMQFVLISY